jgi:hypothetical protein
MTGAKSRKLPRLWDVTYRDAEGVVQKRYSIEWWDYWLLWDNELDKAVPVPGKGGRNTFWSEETGNSYLERTTVQAYERALKNDMLRQIERKLDKPA